MDFAIPVVLSVLIHRFYPYHI